MKTQSNRPCWNLLWKFRATGGKYWSGWGQTGRTKHRANVWAIRSQSLNMPTTTWPACTYMLIPHLVLTAAAYWLLTASKTPYGHVITNKTKENQQSKTCRTVRCSMNIRTDGAWFHVCLYPRLPSLLPSNNTAVGGRQMQKSSRCLWIHFGLTGHNECLWLSYHISVRGKFHLSIWSGFSIFWCLSYTSGYRLTSLSSHPTATCSIVLVSWPQ